MSLLFNTLSRFAIAFLLRTKHLNFMAVVTISSDFEAQENKVSYCFHCFPLEWYHLYIWACWYFSWQSWFQLVIHPAWHLNKQTDNIQPWLTPFPILNQSVVPCPVLTVASWPSYKFIRRQIRWSGNPISLRIFHNLLWSTQSKALM